MEGTALGAGGKSLAPSLQWLFGVLPIGSGFWSDSERREETKAQNPGLHLLVRLHQAMQPRNSNCQHFLTWVLHHTFKFSGKNLINRCHLVPQDPTSYVDCGLFFESLPRGEGKTLNPTTAGSPMES